MTFPTFTVDDLEEFSMIAGNQLTLEFTVYTSGCALADLSSSTITWKLAPFGDTDSVVTKAGAPVVGEQGKFTVKLLNSDTASLSGKYKQQYTVVTSGSYIIPSQGNVNIVPLIV